jgi:hypothetical protein
MGKVKSISKGYNSPELEKFTDVVETTKDQIGSFGSDFFEQLVGFSLNSDKSSSESHQKTPDKPLVVQDPITGAIELFNAANNQTKANNEAKKQHAEKAPQRAEAAIDHHGDFIKSSERALHAENREIKQRLDQIIDELKRLVSTSKVLQMEFAGVSVDQAPQQVGEYHVNFFDWLLLTIRAARQKVEDSGAWLASAKSKGGKKGGYWGMFKKHGTSFGLSNERSVATQTG